MLVGLPGGDFDFELVENITGFVSFIAKGRGVEEFFADEAGGHRWQRIPPNEKRGRVHTSTVTVAVLPEPTQFELKIDPNDLDWSTCRGSGAGGQYRNMTESAVQVFHKSTGLMVRCESERSQHQNRASALALLRARLWQKEQEKQNGQRASNRKTQIGSGMRGDKRRTIRCQDGIVNDHITGQQWSFKEYERGNW